MMTKHQKQAHDSNTTKRSSLQWRPLNEILSSGKRKRNEKKTMPWIPLNEILESAKFMQQQSVTAISSSSSTTSSDDDNMSDTPTAPASPTPSDHSSTTAFDEDTAITSNYKPLPPLVVMDSFGSRYHPMSSDYWLLPQQPSYYPDSNWRGDQYHCPANDNHDHIYINYPTYGVI